MDVRSLAAKTKQAAKNLAQLSSDSKNHALTEMAKALREDKDKVLEENEKDLEKLRAKPSYTNAFEDRLTLNENRIEKMATSLEEVALLQDPIGEQLGMDRRPNGLLVGRMRVPLGVIGIIYEARPNVTAEASSLAFKAGNGILLRGSSDTLNSNRAIVNLLKRGLARAGVNEDVINLVDSQDRNQVSELLKLDEELACIIPRGSRNLIQRVIQESTVPVLQTGEGNCHLFIDKEASLEQAKDIAVNAKTDRPGVCNSLETLLIHKEIAEEVLPDLIDRLVSMDVEIRGCERVKSIIGNSQIIEATEDDWQEEFLDYILAVRVVDDFNTALSHIRTYTTGHSEAIVTENYSTARAFLSQIDAAAVYVNASTRFTDGAEFGMGAEIGISTQKLHARGPMGITELTSTKFIVLGDGQIKK